MLMVFMALIDLGRTGVYRFTRWMWLILSGGLFVSAPLSCSSVGSNTDDGGKDVAAEVGMDNPPQPLYGVDWDVPQVLYGPVPFDAQDATKPDYPQVEYGPVPVDAGDDVPMPMDVQDEDFGMQPLYGPFPVDVPDVNMTDMPQVLYGPVPVDAKDATPADIPQVLYGPVPVDVKEPETQQETSIQPMYGPQPLYGAQPNE